MKKLAFIEKNLYLAQIGFDKFRKLIKEGQTDVTLLASVVHACLEVVGASEYEGFLLLRYLDDSANIRAGGMITEALFRLDTVLRRLDISSKYFWICFFVRGIKAVQIRLRPLPVDVDGSSCDEDQDVLGADSVGTEQ